MMNKYWGTIDQVALEQSFDKLVRESPIPQVLCGDDRQHNRHFPHGSYAPKTSHSVQVVARQQHFDPFLSPPAHYSRRNDEYANQSIADIFKSLKTSASETSRGRYDELYNSNESEEEKDICYKENTQDVANTVHRQMKSKPRDRLPLNRLKTAANHARPQIKNADAIQGDSHGNSNRHEDGLSRYCEQKEPVALSEQCRENGKVFDDRDRRSHVSQETFSEAFSPAYNVEPNSATKYGHDVDVSELATDEVDVSELVADSQELHQWIIKTIPESEAICVEGKRSLSDPEFWHTGVVVQRLSGKVVATQSGSIYKLVGNMELFDALAEGFSHQMCEAFWLGFPEDWETLVQSHFSDQPAKSASTIHKTVAEMSEVDGVSAAIPDEGLQTEKIDTTAEVTCSEDDSDDLTLTEVDTDGGFIAPNTDKHPAAHMKKRGNGKAVNKNEITLTNWIIRKVEGTLGIYVIGNKENGMLWHSNEIEKRIGSRRLQTVSGSIYVLKGNMNNLLALDADLPVGIIKKFRQGFPKDWQECVQDEFGPQIMKDLRVKNKPKVKEQEKTSEPKKKKSNKKEREKHRQSQHNINSSASIGNSSNAAKNVSTSSKKSRSAKKSTTDLSYTKRTTATQKTPATPATPEYCNRSVILANGQMANLDSLGRSRSGRLVKPPMQWWTGQRLCTEGDKVVVTTNTEYASQFLRQIEDGYRRSTTRIKDYFNPASCCRNSSLASSTLIVYDSDASVPSAPEDVLAQANTSIGSNVSAQANKSIGSNVSAQANKSVGLKQKSAAPKSSRKKNNASIEVQAELLNVDLEQEVNDVIHKAKQQRGRNVKTFRKTCYRGNQEAGETTDEAALDLEETLDTGGSESELEVEAPVAVRRSSRGTSLVDVGAVHKEFHRVCKNKKHGEIKKTLTDRDVRRQSKKHGDVKETNIDQCKEQENVVSSSTSNVVDEMKDFQPVPSQKGGRKSKQEVVTTVEPVDSSRRTSRSRRRMSVIETETEQEEVKTNSDRKLRRSLSKVSADTGKVEEMGKPQELHCKEEEPDKWTDKEKKLLSDACGSLDPGHPCYWEHVAEKVRTKSVHSCKQMAFHSQEKVLSVGKKKKKEKPKATALTATVGTLKRKTQLREILEQHDAKYSDDLFGSTPFRNRRKRKMDIEDTMFEEFAKKQGRRFETPVAPSVKGSLFNVKFASAKKTPSVNTKNSSILESTEEEESYAHKIQKRQMASRRSKPATQTKPVEQKDGGGEKSPQTNLFNITITEGEEEEEEENNADSEQEDDFYWNDV